MTVRIPIVPIAVGATLFFGWKYLPAPVRASLQMPIPMKLSLVLWLVFSIYWAVESRKSAPTQTSESRWSRRWHLLLLNGSLLLLVLRVPGLTARFLPASNALVAAGLAIQAAFLLLAVSARRHLGSNWSGEVRIAAEHQLVRSGPYRFIRHPIYTAMIGMYCGTALVFGEIHSAIAIVIITLAYWRKIRLEEAALGATFGADFEAWRQQTSALIPWVY